MKRAPLISFLGREDTGYAEFEKSDMLGRALSALDDRQREVIQMRFFEGEGQREVAQAIGVSQMTFHAWKDRRLRRCARRLRRVKRHENRFIGAGNMGGANRPRHRQKRRCGRKDVFLLRCHPAASEALARDTGATAVQTAAELTDAAELFVLAVKPFMSRMRCAPAARG